MTLRSIFIYLICTTLLMQFTGIVQIVRAAAFGQSSFVAAQKTAEEDNKKDGENKESKEDRQESEADGIHTSHVSTQPFGQVGYLIMDRSKKLAQDQILLENPTPPPDRFI